MQEQKIIAYLKGKATTDEEKRIEDWIMASDQNARKFNLLKAKYIASTFDETSSNIRTDRGYANFVSTVKSISKNPKCIPILKYAAAVAIVFGLGYLYTSNSISEETVPKIPDNVITLKLDNGNIKVITEDGDAKVVDSKGNLVGSQKGTQLIYKKETSVEKLTYNILTVPYGKRFDVILSDGTHVFLNSGTSFRYPVKFLIGKKRMVFLDGEAYFDVAKDVNHPFVVRTDELKVQALGTRFNVSSYHEDEFINTALVEGSVAVYENNQHYNTSTSSLLKPGYKAEWNKGDKRISVKEADVEICTAWLNDKVVFRHMPFKNIIKKLERHYDVVIINQNKQLDDELFTASFDIETIDQVFNTFKESYGMEYSITDNEIIIN